MVSRSDVIAAYRLILGREPESEAVVKEQTRRYAASTDLARAFRSSDEFRDLYRREARLRWEESLSQTQRITAEATRADILLKHIEFRPGAEGMLALPLLSDDPIVAAYATGDRPNDYMLDILEMLTGPGDQVVDLGAHVGTFCVPAALLGRHLLAVDASQRHVRLIETSCQVNNLKSISIVHRAIVREDGPVAFTEQGLFGAVDFANADVNAVRVAGKRLSALLDEHGFDRVRLIKMDIEGSELHGLQSIAERLGQAHGPAILYESNEETFQRAGYSVVDMRLWLEAQGYHTFRIEDARWVYAPPDQPQPELWADMLALKPTHEKRFERIIDRTWSDQAMRDRFFSCASLPYENTRAHLLRLLADPIVRSRHPDLARLAAELAEK